MIKRRALSGLISLVAILFMWSACGEVLNEKSSIAWYMNVAGFNLSENIIEKMQFSHSPILYDCGSVQITLSELLYDGRCLYTAATATPSNPETTIILPASAESTSKISGSHSENLRNDHRSFLEAALQDEKQLLCVYVYPIEFEQSPYYFLDYRQDAENQSTLFSGAIIPWNGDELIIHLSVQIYEVDVVTGAHSLYQEYEFPQTVYPLSPLLEKNYTPIDNTGDELPFNSMTLIQSLLTTYAIPDWKSDDAYNNSEFILTDEAQTTLPHGAPPESDTYAMSQLPKLLYIQIQQYGAQQTQKSYTFFEDGH